MNQKGTNKRTITLTFSIGKCCYLELFQQKPMRICRWRKISRLQFENDSFSCMIRGSWTSMESYNILLVLTRFKWVFFYFASTLLISFCYLYQKLTIISGQNETLTYGIRPKADFIAMNYKLLFTFRSF